MTNAPTKPGRGRRRVCAERMDKFVGICMTDTLHTELLSLVGPSGDVSAFFRDLLIDRLFQTDPARATNFILLKSSPSRPHTTTDETDSGP